MVPVKFNRTREVKMMSNQQASELPLIKREKLIVKLSQSKYFLYRVKSVDRTDEWGLCYNAANGRTITVAKISPSQLKDMLSAGIVRVSGNFAPLTKAGRSFIKRALTNHNDCLGQHQDRVMTTIEDSNRTWQVTTNAKESPLAWLATRKDRKGKSMIEKHQFAAGERLRADYEKALLAPQTTRNWDRMALARSTQKGAPADGLAPSEAAWDAKKRITQAIKVVGPELSGVLIDVCCEQLGLEDCEKRNDLPKRSGKIILRMGLNQLARHYGFLTDDHQIRSLTQRISHWGARDYRPVIDG